MDKRNKKRLKINIVKFIFGCILLFLAFCYIENSPAEKESRNTGIKVISERVEMIFKKITGKYSPAYEYRKSMLSHYEELNYVAQSTECLTEEMKTELTETKQMLESETIDHFNSYRENYYYIRSQYKKHIDDNCQN